MPERLSLGLVYLIPKGGDCEEIRQWRHITLLSTTYKILAILINARVRPLLLDLIHDTYKFCLESKYFGQHLHLLRGD